MRESYHTALAIGKVQINMPRKSKHSKQKKRVTPNPSQADRLFDLVGHQIFQGNYTEAVMNCERLLNYLPPHASMRADVLDQMGTALGMLQNFPQSYAAYTEALALKPYQCRAMVQSWHG